MPALITSSSLLHHFTGALPSPPQLTNWIKYLDFMESKGVPAATVVIYERCLVPCASYPGERGCPLRTHTRFIFSSLCPLGLKRASNPDTPVCSVSGCRVQADSRRQYCGRRGPGPFPLCCWGL